VNTIAPIAPVVAVTGLAFEARIAEGEGVTVVCTSRPQALEEALNEKVRRDVSGILSFGTAAGLDPALTPGCWVVASAIISRGKRYGTHSSWSRNLLNCLPGATEVEIAGVDVPLATPLAKRSVGQQWRAAAADMESHVAAAVAADHALPFAACRVILDPAGRTLPPAALAASGPYGALDIKAMLVSLAQSPSQLPTLLRLALDAHAARRALSRGRRLLGAGLGFPDFGLL
jgi:hopanoid-associated phosphorylase